MIRMALRLASASLLASLLGACSLPTLPTDFDVELSPGSSVVTVEGVYLGAVPEALEGVTRFAVGVVTEPRGTGPFPNAQPLGAFLEIASGDNFATPATKPLLLGLPVPKGVDTSRLALAVLMPAETIHLDTRGLGEGDPDPEPRDTWELLGGRFDPRGQRLVTTLTELPEGGVTAVLVETGAYRSPPLGASLEQQRVALGFEVRCVGFDDLSRSSECTADDETFMSNELEIVFNDLTTRGFRVPELRLEFDISSLAPPAAVPVSYIAELHPFITNGESGDLCLVSANGSGNHGRYTAGIKRVAVCWGEPIANRDGSGYHAGRTDTLRHEYFHATQYAYTDTATSWFKESTAVTAQDSLGTMVRAGNRPVRDVDVSLNGGAQKYALQDFWIFLGMRFGLGIADLIPFLEAGGDEAALELVFARDYPQLGGLAEAYWAWAKNQSFEKEYALGGNGFAQPCGLDTSNKGAYFALQPTIANPGGTPDILTFDYAAPPRDLTFSLPPLTSRVYELAFTALPDAPYDTIVTVTGGSGLRSKFYDPADVGGNACIAAADAFSLPLTVAAGQDETRYLLIANSHASSYRNVTVRFAGDSAPTIAIVSPQGTAFDENDLIDFQALAGGFRGADPALVNISWSYQRNGVKSVFGTTSSGETLTKRFCDGNYTITAEALDAASSQSVSASVSFTVNDLGSTNPPNECRPSITVLEPRPGQTFALGQTITLRAAIDDDHPEIDMPLYPVVWRDGGPSGNIIGTGLEANTKLSAGPHQLYVSYGVANITVGILVESGNPPTATITNPGGDLFIPWTDVPGCDSTFTLMGGGSDPEDGSLSGDSLTWRYRQNGGTSFFLGTGSSVDMNIRCSNSYEVSLTARDAGGLEDNDTVIITVGAPPS